MASALRQRIERLKVFAGFPDKPGKPAGVVVIYRGHDDEGRLIPADAASARAAAAPASVRFYIPDNGR